MIQVKKFAYNLPTYYVVNLIIVNNSSYFFTFCIWKLLPSNVIRSHADKFHFTFTNISQQWTDARGGGGRVFFAKNLGCSPCPPSQLIHQKKPEKELELK